MIKYKTLKESIRIIPISIDRESESCVWVAGNRRNKRNNHEVYHDSKEEAIEYIKRLLNTDIERAENKLNAANDKLKRFNDSLT